MLVVTGNTSPLLTIEEIHSLELAIPTKIGVARFTSSPISGATAVVLFSRAKETKHDLMYVLAAEDANRQSSLEALRKYLDVKQQDMLVCTIEHVQPVVGTAYVSLLVKGNAPEGVYFTHFFTLDHDKVDPKTLNWTAVKTVAGDETTLEVFDIAKATNQGSKSLQT